MKIINNEIRILRLINLCLFILLSTFNLAGQNNYGKPLKFGIVSDVQYADIDNYGSRYYRSSMEKFSEAIRNFRETGVDFVVILGDFIDNNFTSYKPLIEITRGINIPFYFVLGNHDFSVRNGQKRKIPVLLKVKSRYYTISSKNWKLIFLDGTDISTFSRRKRDEEFNMAQSILDSLKTAGAPNAHSWNGGIGKTQLKWFENEIENSNEEGQNIIVFCHFPIYPEDQSENLLNANEIRNIFESRDGKTVFFNGHTHRSNHLFNNGVHYVSLRGMVEMDENSYAIAEIYNDSILIKGYGAEKSFSISW